ncbi:hypothetical protein BDM02DRAFT_3191430 [Thelephora ganbajun]|uniref:Uncharacterized protein n=1 Tax=Thelephora ganbajun TaxID=370292 RepID=A0ACB6Z266_THEGA|nr:hypothetical protein BDM02DRAFT_3191430 [Thelephora ganbajun]
MAHLVDAQFRRFQLDPEAFDLAKQIYRQIQVKTAPGSGHELGASIVGVPAIAAYLACIHLNSSDVDYNTAASASCVRPVVFKKILGIVQDLVEIEPLRSRTEERDGDVVTYAELMQAFRLRHYQSVLLGWFKSTESALLGSGELRGSDLKAVKNVTLLRCVVFAWVCEVSKSQHVEPEMVKLKFQLPSETFDDLMRTMTAACSHIKAQIRRDRQALLKNHTPTSSANPTPSKPHRDNSSVSRSVSKSPSKSALKRKLSALDGVEQNTPSKRVAFMKSVPEVDEGESSEDETMETPSKQRTRLFADEVAAAVTPMAKLQPEGQTTEKARYRSRASRSRETLDQLPVDDENPMQVDSPSFIPIATPATAVPTTPRRKRTTPSTPKRTPGSRGKGKSTPRRNGEDDGEGELELPPRYRPVFLDHRQWYARDPRIEKEIAMGEELRRTFREKFGQSIIDKYRPTATT